MVRVALIGDYDPTVIAHQAIPLALERAGREAGGTLAWTWVDTASIGSDVNAPLAEYAGIWCVPASPLCERCWSDRGDSLRAGI
jgi:CTP synthase (UTP-ammonia lyase)